jgi:hypothetical protein
MFLNISKPEDLKVKEAERRVAFLPMANRV